VGDPSSSATSFLLLQDAGLTGSAVVGLGWGMHAGACWGMHAGACWGMHAGASQWPDKNGWPLTMTVALPQQVAQANLPRSRACQRECQSVRGWHSRWHSRWQGNRAWLRPQAGALQQQRRGWPARPRRAVRHGLRVGQRLTLLHTANLSPRLNAHNDRGDLDTHNSLGATYEARWLRIRCPAPVTATVDRDS
jgi:hypothetical protein